MRIASPLQPRETHDPSPSIPRVPRQPPSQLPADATLTELVVLATHLLRARAGALLLAEPRGDWLTAAFGLATEAPRLFEGQRIGERTAVLPSGLFQLDAAQLARQPLAAYAPAARSLIAAPVVSPDGAWHGALALLDLPAGSGPAETGVMLSMFGRQLAARLDALRKLRGLEEAEAALQESERRLHVFAQNAPDVLYQLTLAPRPRIDFVSPSIRDVLGCGPEQLHADPGLLLRRIHPEDRARLRLLRRGDTRTLTLRWRRSDGALVHTEHRQRIFKDEAGCVRVEGIARDVTERIRLDEQRWRAHALFQAVIEGSSDAIFVKGLDGRYVLINPAGAQLLGRGVDEILGRRDEELFSPESAREILRREREILAQGEPSTYESTSTAAGVTRVWLSTKTPLRERTGKISGLLGVCRDITLLREREAEVMRRSDALLAAQRAREGWRKGTLERLGEVERLASLPPGPELLAEVDRLRTLASRLRSELEHHAAAVP
jgi:PAS domain S-box-containing protein